jgi:hypothetical protein
MNLVHHSLSCIQINVINAVLIMFVGTDANSTWVSPACMDCMCKEDGTTSCISRQCDVTCSEVGPNYQR